MGASASSEERKSPEFKRYVDMVGSTPLCDISSLLSEEARASGVKLLGKLEFINPTFSMKDRIIATIFDKAEERGDLKPGMTIVCASSGNTGAACAMLASVRGYKAIIITNAKCSKEKMDTIKAYGAELLIARSDQNYMKMETEMAAEHEDWFSVNQYESQDNPLAHQKGTGAEILVQTHQQVTHFVAGGSTGGTVTGVGRALKAELGGKVQIIMADPVGSIFHPVIEGKLTETEAKGKTGTFLVEGVGKKSLPGAFDPKVVERVVQVSDDEAFAACRTLSTTEGLMVGGSAGLNVAGAVKVGNELKEPAVIVTILCDLGVKYLTKVYNPEWLKEHNLKTGAESARSDATLEGTAA